MADNMSLNDIYINTILQVIYPNISDIVTIPLRILWLKGIGLLCLWGVQPELDENHAWL